MALRKLKVASQRFSQPGELLSSKQDAERLKLFVSDLLTLCPQAGGLESSTLETYKLDDPYGTILQYWLHEAPQRNLAVAVQQAGRRQIAGNDGFANDVAQLVQGIQDAQGFFIVAVEPVYTAEQLRAPDLFAARVRQIRKRVTQRQLFQIPTVDGAGIAMENAGNSLFPIAYIANIEANVHSSIRLGTKLNSARFIGAPPLAIAELSIPNQILLHRPDTEKDAMLMRILDKAMDSSRKVRLRVLVNLYWVDGSIDSLTYSTLYKRPYRKDSGST